MRKYYTTHVTLKIDIEAENKMQAKAIASSKISETMPFEVVGVDVIQDVRSDQQNKALHLWFTKVADKCQESGIDMKSLFESVELPVTDYRLKDVYKKIIQHMFGITSTTKLSKEQLQEACDVLDRLFLEKGVQVNFPSEEELQYEQRGWVSTK